MLHLVPRGINALTRNVVINHPNTFNCQVYRKEVTRDGGGTMGGKQLMGGIGVIETDDEEKYEYNWIGNGYALPAQNFEPARLVSRGDANVGPDEFQFLIAPEEPSGSEDWFDIRTHDIVYILLGSGPKPAKLAFEVVGRDTTVNIAPFCARYVCNRRDDLHLPAGSY